MTVSRRLFVAAVACLAARASGAGKVQRAVCSPPDQIVFGVGLPKSGTRSLGAAARALGFRGAKGMLGSKGDGIDYRHNADLLAFARGERSRNNSLARLDRGAPSTLYADFPFYALTCELAATYPSAKFVDVVRPCGEWARSALRQLFCEYLRRGCEVDVAADTPHTHTAVGFRTTRWYFDRYEPGLVDAFCARRADVCVPRDRARGVATAFDERAASATGLLARLENVCRAHPRALERCIPRDRLLTLRLESDAGEAVKLAPFLGCGDVGADILERAWVRNGPKGHKVPPPKVLPGG